MSAARLSRRHFGALGIAGLGTAGLGSVGLGSVGLGGAWGPWGLALANPAPATPAVLRLTAAAGTVSLAPDQPTTPILGYGGALPGPVLRARRGEMADILLRNDLAEPTGLHVCGLRRPADGTHLAPGAERAQRLALPEAGTLLYRPSLLSGEAQLRQGLAGLLLVDEATPPLHDREVPLVLAEAPGGLMLVNGRGGPDLTVRPGERLWLRLANATASRVLRLALPDQTLTLIALDSQPCEPFPLEGGRIVLAPGQRADLIWDVTASGAILPIQIARFGGQTLSADIPVAGPQLRDAPLPPPRPLPPNAVPQAMDFRRALRWDWPIGGTAEAPTLAGREDRTVPGTPAFRARPGSVVVATIRNDAPVLHALHLQGQAARLLDGLDDGWKPYFLDTVLVAPGMTVRIAFVAEQTGRFLVTSQPINAEGGPVAIAYDVT
ncbi:multicopper oxidase family protein [Phreatobacter sp.]|uniref:multicopper oxidase family protein n=1 Tax=Phreatobacter sp. TaxID=1966341 RepID=UPI0022CBC096|nr:multicopper oxidase family protein [Phreatobacter sp.]MCZ8315079.1 multicopper oxidase family protein [Phreatobacter sp.]